MRYARIVDGVVAEIIELPADLKVGDGADSPERAATLDDLYPAAFVAGLVGCDDAVGEGWTYADGGFSEPPAVPLPALQPITRRQLRLTLLAHGLLDQVEPAIAALDEPERSVAMIEWQDASEYRRDHVLIAQIGGALGIDPTAIDVMWIEAMGR